MDSRAAAFDAAADLDRDTARFFGLAAGFLAAVAVVFFVDDFDADFAAAAGDVVADFLADRTDAGERFDADFLAVDFVPEVLFAVDFFAADFFELGDFFVDFLADDFFAAAMSGVSSWQL